MKKLLFLLIMFIAYNLYSQEKTEDYYTIGLYGGGHTSNSLGVTKGPFNAIALELEYIKSKKWGFFMGIFYKNNL